MSRVAPRSTRARLLALATVALTALGVAASLDAPAAAAGTRHYVAARSACTQPVGAFRCFAKRLVPVPAGAAGAIPADQISAAGHGYGGGLSPADLAKFYNYNRSGGSGQTVAVVMWGSNPYIRSDLTTFERYNHLPGETSSSFRVVNQNGASHPLPNSSNRVTGTHGEISLDVETVRAVCAKCRILLVEASVDRWGQPSDSGLAAAVRTAVRLGATVISNSWGGPENQMSGSNPLAKAFRQPGVVITASTGDAGWYSWDFAARGSQGDNAASFPSTSPYVVSVGGTTIRRRADGTRAGEAVWNTDGGSADAPAYGASGGGCSTRYTAPYWQRTTPGYSSAHCGNRRLAADVSADADPATGLSIYSRSEGGWGRYGGTSLSSPIVAGMYALAGGSGGSAFPAASLYVNIYRAHRSGGRYDVTYGGTGFCGADATQVCSAAVGARSRQASNNPNYFYRGTVADCSFPHAARRVSSVPTQRSRECNAAAGYDGPSGVGAPNGLSIFHDTSATAKLTGPRTVRVGHAGVFAATVRNAYGARTRSVSWSFGDGATRGNAPARVAHKFTRKGKFVLGYTATDSYGQSVVRRQYVTVR